MDWTLSSEDIDAIFAHQGLEDYDGNFYSYFLDFTGEDPQTYIDYLN